MENQPRTRFPAAPAPMTILDSSEREKGRDGASWPSTLRPISVGGRTQGARGQLNSIYGEPWSQVLCCAFVAPPPAAAVKRAAGRILQGQRSVHLLMLKIAFCTRHQGAHLLKAVVAPSTLIAVQCAITSAVPGGNMDAGATGLGSSGWSQNKPWCFPSPNASCSNSASTRFELMPTRSARAAPR